MPDRGNKPADARYTHGHHDSVLRSHRWRTAENSAAYLLPRLAPGMNVLDVGCGPGTITADLAAVVAPGRVVGLDLVAVEGRPTSPYLSFVNGDVYSLEFPAESFDVVHAHQVLQHLIDPVAALREMARVCKPGGTIAVRDGDYSAFAWWPGDERLDRWLDVYRAVARANGGEPDAGRHLLRWAHAAGLSDLEASASAWCFATPEDRAWWGGLWAERISSPDSALARRAVELGLADAAELDDMAAAWHQWAAHPDGWFAVLHGELLCTPSKP
jgi:SAM-dependent methyltransferase